MSDQFLYQLRLTRPAMLQEGATEHESAAVAAHFSYLQTLLAQGRLLMAGRTQTNDARTFGLVIFLADTQAQAEATMQADPAIMAGVMRGELFPYRVALWSDIAPLTG